MASTVLRLEAAFRKIPGGVEDDLFASTEGTPGSSGYRLGDSQATARTLRNLLQQIDSGSYPGVEFLQLDEWSSVETASGYFADVTMDAGALNVNDTITVGGVVFTWVLGAANENEITISIVSASCAANLAAAVVSHSRLAGLLTGSSASDVATLRTLGCSRWGGLITIATSNAAAMALSAGRFLPDRAGTITAAASPVFTLDPATFSLPEWEMLIGQQVNAVDATLVAPVNTVGPLDVLAVTASGDVTLGGDPADLAALAPTNVFVPIFQAQTATQRMNYGANQ